MGIFGGGSDYGAAQDKRQATRYLQEGGDIASILRGYGSQFGNRLGTALGNQDSSYKTLREYLQTDPNTDQYRTEQFAKAAAGGTQQATANQNALISMLTNTGMAAPGGGPSSAMAGGLAALKQQQYNTDSGIRNQIAYNAVQDHQNRLQGLYGLDTGQVNQDNSNMMGAYNAAGGLDLGIAGQYGSLYGTDASREAASGNEAMGLLGAAGGLIGSGAGSGLLDMFTGKRKPAGTGGALGNAGSSPASGSGNSYFGVSPTGYRYIK